MAELDHDATIIGDHWAWQRARRHDNAVTTKSTDRPGGQERVWATMLEPGKNCLIVVIDAAEREDCIELRQKNVAGRNYRIAPRIVYVPTSNPVKRGISHSSIRSNDLTRISNLYRTTEKDVRLHSTWTDEHQGIDSVACHYP